MKPSELRPLLKRLRNRFVKIAVNHSQKHFSYWDLSGWCAICSYTIFKILKKKGLKPSLCTSMEHAFVMLGNHYIDITATQFLEKAPAVYVNKKPLGPFHHIVRRTDQEEMIWDLLCKGWAQPISPQSEKLHKIIKTF